jgi:hypothetical protein
MNLWCKEMELTQTPTYITELCYYADLDKRTASPWKTIRAKYEKWLASIANQTQDWDRYNKHVKKLRSFKTLHFYIS